jgi:hypothetical protein
MDLADFRKPVEVYEAAIGNPKPLAERLRSGERLTEMERDALAALVEGKLKSPNLGPGKGRPNYLWTTWEAYVAMKLPNAEALYRHVMRELRKVGEHYGRAEEVIEYVAKRNDIHASSVKNYLRRAKAEKVDREPRGPRNAVEWFHRWLYERGLTGFGDLHGAGA